MNTDCATVEKVEITNNISDSYIGFLRKYIPVGDGLLWVLAYAMYVHSIDDIIDNEIPNAEDKHQFILETFEFAEVVYTNIFYQQNINRLRPLVKMASNCYIDSIKLEKGDKPRHKIMADSLRCAGNEVILAVIEIYGGPKLRNEASIELRELSYKTHHNALGQPV